MSDLPKTRQQEPRPEQAGDLLHRDQFELIVVDLVETFFTGAALRVYAQRLKVGLDEAVRDAFIQPFDVMVDRGS